MTNKSDPKSGYLPPYGFALSGSFDLVCSNKLDKITVGNIPEGVDVAVLKDTLMDEIYMMDPTVTPYYMRKLDAKNPESCGFQITLSHPIDGYVLMNAYELALNAGLDHSGLDLSLGKTLNVRAEGAVIDPHRPSNSGYNGPRLRGH